MAREMILGKKELKDYRDRLYELQLKAFEEREFEYCSNEIWAVYGLNSRRGRQIYESYTKEELARVALHARRRDNICRAHPTEWHPILKQYFRERFGTLEEARLYANRRFRVEKERMYRQREKEKEAAGEGKEE